MLSEAKIGPRGWPYYCNGVLVGDGQRRAGTPLRAAQDEAGAPAGFWTGRGLAAVGLVAGDVVTERQAELLLAEGRHPDADRIERERLEAGDDPAKARRATVLGRPIEHNQLPKTEKAKERSPWLAMDLVFRAPSTAQIAWALWMTSAAWCWSCVRTSPGTRRWRGWRTRLHRSAGGETVSTVPRSGTG